MKKARNQKSRIKRAPGAQLPERQRTRYVWLNVLPDDLFLKVRQGETVWEALRETDVELKGECGGLGKCGKCKVRVLSSLGPPSEEENRLLLEEEITQGIRLACRTEVDKDLVINIGETDSEIDYSQILQTGYRPIFQMDPVVNHLPVTFLSDYQDEDISDFGRIKLAMGAQYQDLEVSLHCLQTLPETLKKTPTRGVAVLHEHYLLAWQNWSKLAFRYGLVFDLGTTTLVGKLIDLMNGTEIAVTSRLNSQIKHGTNVISRLQFVKEHSKGLDYLHNFLIKDINRIIKRLLSAGGIEQDEIFVAIAAGNTTMQHFLLNLSPLGISEAPFTPVLTDGLIAKAADAGLQLHPEALLYVMPAKSGYIGGDLISVMLASGVIEQEDELILGLDLGTNGEIFLGNARKLMTCSAAAGPALEGSNISYGMIAKAGAIEAVSFEEGDLHYQVIGNIKPKGICGSGLVELIAVLLELGIINQEGLICSPERKVAKDLRSRIINRAGVNDFLIASAEDSYDNEPIYLTQKDVREVQLAKGAIRAGVETLMAELGIAAKNINRVYLAGALGNYANPYSAMRIGLIPRVDRGIITSLGNAASTGASMALLSKYYWQIANELGEFIEHIELSSRLDFNEQFIQQMDFPSENVLHVYREDADLDVMRTIKVSEIMNRDFDTVPSTMTLNEMSDRLRSTGHHGFLVLDEEDRLFGVATLADLETYFQNGVSDLTVRDIATRELFLAYPDQNLYEVLGATDKDYGRIPVVDRNNPHHLLGVLHRQDIMQAYHSRPAQATKTDKDQ